MPTVRVSWDPPTSTGGSPITGYAVRRKTGTTGSWINLASVGSAARSYDDATPVAGSQYVYEVAAVNAVGTGPFSAETTQATITVAAAQAALSVNAHYYGNATQADRNGIASIFAAAKATGVRIDIGWANAQPTSAAFDGNWLTDVDAIVNTNYTRGLRTLLVMYLTPPWANGTSSAPDYNVGPTNASTFASYCGSLASRYAGKGVDYQMWNEPNYPVQSFFKPNPAVTNPDGSVMSAAAQYARLVTAAYPAIKAGDPAAQVIAGGTSGTDVPFLTACLDAGMGPYMDALSVHPYPSPSDSTPEAAALTSGGVTYNLLGVDSARTLLNNRGLSSKPIWLTEFGYSTFTNTGSEAPYARGVTQAQAADYLTRAMAVINARPQWNVRNLFWYVARDEPTFTGAMEQNYGLLYHDLTPKAAISSFAAYTGGTAPAGGTPTPAKANLLTSAQATFSSITGWLPNANTTFTVQSSVVQATTDTSSGQLTAKAAANVSVETNTRFAVTAGTSYTASVYGRPATVPRYTTVYLNWFDTAGAFLSQSTATAVQTAGTWVQTALVASAPAGAVAGSLTVEVGTPTAAGETFYIDTASVTLS